MKIGALLKEIFSKYRSEFYARGWKKNVFLIPILLALLVLIAMLLKDFVAPLRFL